MHSQKWLRSPPSLPFFVVTAVIVLLILLNFYLAWQPWSRLSGNFFWISSVPQDTHYKLRHIVQFTPQALLFHFYLKWFFQIKQRLNFQLTLALFGSVGVLSETIQVFSPSRIFSFLDIAWNLLAVGLAALLFKGMVACTPGSPS